MKILVTGGAGYIGSHTVLQLNEAGHETIILDDFSKGHREYVFSSHLIEGKVHDRNLIRSIIRKYSIEAIFHFAAFIEAGESMNDPAKYFFNNTEGSLALIDTAIECGVKYIIFSSTAAIYGFPEVVPISESSILNPANPYGESKLMVEQALRWYSKIGKINYVALRYFNACGADALMRTGEIHNPETHLIPIAIQTAYGERDSMRINGTDYNTNDGTCIRDYVHVEDLARAHILSLAYLASENKSEVFNLGSQSGHSVREVIESVKEVTGRDFLVEEGPRRPGDPDQLIASSEKIRQVIGWEPRYTDLKEIIRTADSFYRRRKGL